MILLFAHDHRFFRDRGGALYSTGSLPARVWDRYLRHFDQVQVLARIEEASDVTGMALSSHERVSFFSGPDLTTARAALRLPPEARKMIAERVACADAVVARVPSEIGQAAIREARRLGKPYTVEVVGCPWDTYINHGSLRAKLFAPYATARMRRAVARAPRALYVTEKWLQSRYPCRGRTNHASNVEIEPATTEAVAQRKARLLELAGGRLPILGSVASLKVSYKGVQTAIAALARLRAEGLDLTYRVLGPGDPSPWQGLAREAGVGDLVFFDGTRPAGTAVLDWIGELDIHLQPSLQEGLPRSTIEAMSRGTACVGSTCGGIPELLPAERTHAPGDVDALARIVAWLARSPEDIAAASERDFTKASEYFADRLRARRDDMFAELRQAAESAR